MNICWISKHNIFEYIHILYIKFTIYILKSEIQIKYLQPPEGLYRALGFYMTSLKSVAKDFVLPIFLAVEDCIGSPGVKGKKINFWHSFKLFLWTKDIRKYTTATYQCSHILVLLSSKYKKKCLEPLYISFQYNLKLYY